MSNLILDSFSKNILQCSLELLRPPSLILIKNKHVSLILPYKLIRFFRFCLVFKELFLHYFLCHFWCNFIILTHSFSRVNLFLSQITFPFRDLIIITYLPLFSQLFFLRNTFFFDFFTFNVLSSFIFTSLYIEIATSDWL